MWVMVGAAVAAGAVAMMGVAGGRAGDAVLEDGRVPAAVRPFCPVAEVGKGEQLVVPLDGDGGRAGR